uniref:Uncharacterized protein n=1 Tax=Physcomitrium patens TaxID=3218 RepID=A0A7I4DAB5_PHYPA
MASSSNVMRSAAVAIAVISSVATMANAQAESPAPPPSSAAFSLMPSMLAPILGMAFAFFASRMACCGSPTHQANDFAHGARHTSVVP